VLLQATGKIEAVRLRAHRLAVIRGGSVIARSEPVTTGLDIEGRPNTVNPANYAPAEPEDS